MSRSKSTSARRVVGAEVRLVLRAQFPLAFAGKSGVKRPLKVGIHHDIHAALPELAMWKIKAALTDYTRGPKYARAMLEGATRVDLDGQPAGIVTKEQAQQSVAYLLKWGTPPAAPHALALSA